MTGSGKSTLVNCLAGCELRGLSEDERVEKNLPCDAIVVMTKAEGGPKDPVTAVGLNKKSQTEVLSSICSDCHPNSRF